MQPTEMVYNRQRECSLRQHRW